METFWSVLIIISAIAIIIAVTMQEGKDSTDSTFLPAIPIWGKNKGVGKEFTLKRITIVSFVAFIVSTMGLMMTK